MSDPLLDAGVPATITEAADGVALAHLIEECVPPSLRAGKAGRILDMYLVAVAARAKAQRDGDGRALVGREADIVRGYRCTREALLELLPEATAEPVPSGSGAASTHEPAPRSAALARPPPAMWARRLLHMTVGGAQVVTVTPAPRLPDTIRDGIDAVALADLITGSVPSESRTPTMWRLVALTTECARLEPRGDSAQRAPLDAEASQIYPGVLGDVRALLDTPVRQRQLAEAERVALETALAVLATPTMSQTPVPPMGAATERQGEETEHMDGNESVSSTIGAPPMVPGPAVSAATPVFVGGQVTMLDPATLTPHPLSMDLFGEADFSTQVQFERDVAEHGVDKPLHVAGDNCASPPGTVYSGSVLASLEFAAGELSRYDRLLDQRTVPPLQGGLAPGG